MKKFLEWLEKMGIILPWHEDSTKAAFLDRAMLDLEERYGDLESRSTSDRQRARYFSWYEERRDKILTEMKDISKIDSNDYHEIVGENRRIAGGAI